mgnify:CR=1 FL=1
MAFSSGKKAYFISDRSGFRFPYKDRIKEWNGTLVSKTEFEFKHPQLNSARKVTGRSGLRNARPDRTEPAITVLLTPDPFTTGTSGGSSTTITVKETSHSRSVSSQVRFRDVSPFDGISAAVMELAAGYAIVSVVDTNNYTVSVSATATTGSIKGGGKVVSAGPVTVES